VKINKQHIIHSKVSKYLIGFICLVVMVFSIAACSTKKDKWVNRKYHQVVAHYNALWNGKESYKQAISTIDKSYKDDFTKILPIYKFPDDKTAQSIQSNTNRSIEKASKVIKKHSMRFSGREKNPEIDDAYLLIGKSCLLSRDFLGAEATFKHIITNWKKTEVVYEPMIWLALTYTKQGKYSESEIVLKEVQKAIDNKKAPKKLKDFLYTVWAENDIASGKEMASIEKLDLRKKKIFKSALDVRIYFIKGQIYLRNSEYEQAYKCFQKAYNKAKDYNMQFVAKLNQALCFETGDRRSIKVIEDLEKMLDKEINKDYNDQIYYAIGEIYYKNKSINTACKKWEQSVTSSTTNTTQKIASSIRVADVYYNEVENYQKAAMYYDTALALIDRYHTDYRRITDRQRVLTTLVKNLNTIERWDSLLALSELPESELNAKIDKWIAEYKYEQEKKKAQEELEKAIAQRNAQINSFSNSNLNNKSAFYFNNPSTVQAGKIEFERKWGKRALEDNWRLEQKEEIGFETDDSPAENSEDSLADNENTAKSSSFTPENREYYTKDIPYTQGAKDTANAEIADALLEAGYILWQGVGNTTKSVETFLDLHKRYPSHKNILPSSYHLYKEYEQLGDYPSSNYYKNKILNEYPESEFAMMLKNPSFWDNKDESIKKQDLLYKKAYDYYANNEFLSAINSTQLAIDSIKVGEYIPRLQYIAALSKGKLYGIDSLANNLNMIIFNFPNSDVTPLIENQLRYLTSTYNIKEFDIKYDEEREKRTPTIDSTTLADNIVNTLIDSTQKASVNRDDILDAESLVYKYKDGMHYFVLLADDSKFDADYLTDYINNFNKTSFADLNLSVSANLFTSTYQILGVRKFKNMDEAFAYYDSIQKDSTFMSFNSSYYKCFIISIQNYATFYSKRNIEAYQKFFKLMYLNNREEKEN
jgi:tetratricopeptide (TPR) repeat protein